ncbi:MAG: PDZ domain-containing protein, partial [Phascolarctobacterium sp.]|nr:PDZ domain-containing protein [Phascolarctobacterium sp.]
MKYFWNALAVVVLSIVFALGMFCYTAYVMLGDVGEAVKLVRTKSMIERYYYGEIDSHKLLEGAIRGMVDAVDDPYTSYLDKKEFQRLTDMTQGSFSGIGVVFGKRNNQYQIMSVIEDNPGAKAGIKEGDIIISVNGESTAKMSMDAVANNIRGPIDSEV